MKVVISPNVCMNLESEFSSTSQKFFLSNTRNKKCFIDLLADVLMSNGDTVRESVGDADVDFVPSVLDTACEEKMLLWLERIQIVSSYFRICGMILWAEIKCERTKH